MSDRAMAGLQSGSQHAELDSNRTTPFVNPTIPNVARIYDFLLGGKNNYESDREAATRLIQMAPDVLSACHHNRQFLQRAVRFLAAEAGIRQFIDIGTGLPTQGNVHEIAQGVNPAARVAYVDYDPVVIAHAQALLATNPTVIAVQRDLRFPDQILGHPALQALIDFNEPVALLLVAVLHFISDDEAYAVLGNLKDALPPGSFLVLSHITPDEISDEVRRDGQAVYERATSSITPRPFSSIARFFDGLRIVEPGIVNVNSWHAEEALIGPQRTLIYAGVARKP